MKLDALGEMFESWWQRDGRYIDPDTDDVPWFDKRKELCEHAFRAAMAQSGNYTADREVLPQAVTFVNGRRVSLNEGWRCLEVEMLSPPPPQDP